MSWKLAWTRPALKDMKRLDKGTARRIREELLHLAATGHGDVKRMKGERDKWRLRVGGWRAIVTYRHATLILLVLRVRRRDKAYR
jgi:mRNA interferase RelE/StbE